MNSSIFRRNTSLVIVLVLMVSMFITPMATFGEEDSVDISVLATSDIHGSINSYDYASGDDYGERGLAIISSIVNEIRENSENTMGLTPRACL